MIFCVIVLPITVIDLNESFGCFLTL
jgi:hypothetical protein